MKVMNFDLGLTGFDLAEIDRLLEPAEGLTEPDEVPPVPAEPVTRPGICGSSANLKSVRWFRQEYYCDFAETEGALFSYDDVMGALSDKWSRSFREETETRPSGVLTGEVHRCSHEACRFSSPVSIWARRRTSLPW